MQKPYRSIRVVIADDHDIYRDGFRSMLASNQDIELVAEAADGASLLQVTAVNDPDVILTDIRMPVMNGIEATRQLTAKFPHIAVVALTMFNEDHQIIDMLAAGAKGYLLKDAPKADIINAIGTVHRNENYFCNTIAKKLARMVAHNMFDPELREKKIPLSDREKEVLKLLCEQKSNRDISLLLGLSVRTIEGFRADLLQKTGSQNVAGLVVFAIKYGIFTPE